MASLWKLPVIYDREQPVCHGDVQSPGRIPSPTLYKRGAASAFPASRSTGWTCSRSRAAGEKASNGCRERQGPDHPRIMTYRYRGHSMSDPAKYRTREEVQKMREKRDPIEQVRRAC
jgi:pyruvate dehydrogenase E1 component alpha subunit